MRFRQKTILIGLHRPVNVSAKPTQERPSDRPYRLENGVATITMDDGKVNVMSISAGFDLKIFAANDPGRSLEMVRAGADSPFA